MLENAFVRPVFILVGPNALPVKMLTRIASLAVRMATYVFRVNRPILSTKGAVLLVVTTAMLAKMLAFVILANQAIFGRARCASHVASPTVLLVPKSTFAPSARAASTSSIILVHYRGTIHVKNVWPTATNALTITLAKPVIRDTIRMHHKNALFAVACSPTAYNAVTRNAKSVPIQAFLLQLLASANYATLLTITAHFAAPVLTAFLASPICITLTEYASYVINLVKAALHVRLRKLRPSAQAVPKYSI